MSRYLEKARRAIHPQQGQAYMEYAPIVLLVGIFLVVVVAAMGQTLVAFFNSLITILGR